MRIAINGIGVAGPTLAYWLRKSGHEVLLTEEASRLRTGGYIIDFWGLGYDIAERMGILPQVRERGYHVDEVRFVNGRGQRTGGFGTDVFARLTGGRFTSLRRSDLAAAIYGALDSGVETIFGDSITAITSTGRGLLVNLLRGGSREVDLVIGADGLHSTVRRLLFGPDAGIEVSLGYHVAAFETGGYHPRDELVYLSYSAPGRQLSRFALRGDRTLFLFVFRDEYLNGPAPTTLPDRRAVLGELFGDIGREGPAIIAALDGTDDLYFDRVSQIRLPQWWRGRTALVGDAAACVSLLAGEGTGLAMAESYVLAGELCRAPGDYATAFARYQALMQPFLRGKQESAARFASSFAPRTAAGIALRNAVTRLLGIPLVAEWFIGRDLRDNFTLPDYRFQGG